MRAPLLSSAPCIWRTTTSPTSPTSGSRPMPRWRSRLPRPRAGRCRGMYDTRSAQLAVERAVDHQLAFLLRAGHGLRIVGGIAGGDLGHGRGRDERESAQEGLEPGFHAESLRNVSKKRRLDWNGATALLVFFGGLH